MIRDGHPGSRVQILIFTHTGSRGQKGTGSRIQIRITALSELCTYVTKSEVRPLT
jgi:hypothetical protein